MLHYSRYNKNVLHENYKTAGQSNLSVPLFFIAEHEINISIIYIVYAKNGGL